MTNRLGRIRIVLVEPSHSGNIGATARAMKNMGLSQLALVNPKQFPDQVALTRAAGADDILEHAMVCSTLAEALAGCHYVYGTSARSRNLSLPLFTPREAATKICAEHTDVAIVFGRESSGLTNEELSHVNAHIQIPTAPTFSSLNLSQAILLICYELSMAAGDKPSPQPMTDPEPLATCDQIEGFYSHLTTTLTDINFLDPKQPKLLMRRLKRLFSRAQLEEKEINILRGILAAVDYSTQTKQKEQGVSHD